MAQPDYVATGVRIRRRFRSLTRAGQVRVCAGELELLTSYGREIDSAPLHRVRVRGGPGGQRVLAVVDGTRYHLRTAGDRRGELLNGVRTAQAKAAAELGILEG
ncbi:hypothetical protein [Streptomyces sp. TR06-5]|uniref:hypothetical protein n=1 Tax=unclassified Streptomyces TaxID=2593676 RepID=UPI0039A33283